MNLHRATGRPANVCRAARPGIDIDIHHTTGPDMKLHRAAERRMTYGRPAAPADPSVTTAHAARSPMDTASTSRPPTPTTAWPAGVAAAATGSA